MSQGGAMTDTHEDARPRGPGAAMKAGGPSTTSCTSPNVKPQHLCGASSVPLQAALAYARAGYLVFSCRQDKTPYVKWRDDATTDEGTIRQWWRDQPDAMIGLPTGSASGLFVLDVDIHKKTGEAIGEQTISRLGLEHALKEVPTASTPSGGRHCYFRHPGDGWGNTAGKIGEGVDTRGEGGYIIAPGSNNGAGAYQWIGASIFDRSPPELPGAIKKALTAPETGPERTCNLDGDDASKWADRALTEELARVATAHKGARNDTLNRAAFSLGQIVGAGHLDRARVEAELMETALRVGLDEDKIRATTKSGLEAGENQPRGPKEQAVSSGGQGKKQADLLIQIAGAADLFHAPDSKTYADLNIDGHRETWPIRTGGFRRWLAREFYLRTGGAPNSEALQSALNVIEAKAHFDGPERPVFIRVAGLEDRLYLDLGDDAWRAVEIDATGWRVIDEPPVRFRRAAGMQALPMPVPGGSVDTLHSFLNVRSDADFVLVVAWALAVLRNRGPYPVIVLSGEQGSAKSTFSAILKALLDPNTAPLRALPREIRDLFIAANNGHVLAFDNVSGLRGWISDTLCRLATGGGFAVRQLYTDQDEVLFDAARPVILNGIEDIVTRPDLADRAIFLTLEPIPDECRRTEVDLWAEFEAERPLILGALLDAMVGGLKHLPETRLPRLPRMADFALWASACETALWPDGTFWAAYCGNRDEAVEGVIEADPVATAVRTMMQEQTVWTGTASDLLVDLAGVAGERIAISKSWPDNARALSGRLRRAATFLRKVGIDVEFKKEGRARTRMIRITNNPDQSEPEFAGMQPSAPSAPSAVTPIPNPAKVLPSSELRTVADIADGKTEDPVSTVRANPLNNHAADGADGADANSPLKSGDDQTDGGGWTTRL